MAVDESKGNRLRSPSVCPVISRLWGIGMAMETRPPGFSETEFGFSISLGTDSTLTTGFSTLVYLEIKRLPVTGMATELIRLAFTEMVNGFSTGMGTATITT